MSVDPQLLSLGFAVALLSIAYVAGSRIERRHYASIRRREQGLRHLPTITFRDFPSAWVVTDCSLVTGSVVISIDHFKRFLAALRGLVGGRVKSYETLLDRARREALLRLKEAAVRAGHAAVINVRIETSRMANGRGGEGTAGVEVLAFGTGLSLRDPPG